MTAITNPSAPPSPLLSALSDPTRRGLFELLVQRARSVGELAQCVPVTRSAVSQHLKVLKEAGLVGETKAGQQNIYAASEQAQGLLACLGRYAQDLCNQLTGGTSAALDAGIPQVAAPTATEKEVDEPGDLTGVNWAVISDEVAPDVVRLVARMFIMGNRLDKLFTRTAAGHGLNTGEAMILGTLRRLGDEQLCTPTQLGKSSLISLPGIAKRLNRLEHLGLVERVVDELDRRSVKVRLTPTGQQVFLAISHEQFTHNYAAFFRLPSAQRSQLDETLGFLLRELPAIP